MLSIDDFSAVTLESKEQFKAHYRKYPIIHSDYVFNTMVAWKEYAHYEYLIKDDALFIKTTVDGIIQFRPPIGLYDQNSYNQFFKLVKKEGAEYPISLITEDVKQWINTNYESISFIAQPEYYDYVYLTKDLAHLDGANYRKIRNRLNKFTKNYEYETILISEDIIHEVKQFLKRWCIWRDCEGDPLLDYERKAIMFSTDNFKELELSGIAVRVNNRIEAISIFEQMNPDTVVVHFEKGSPDYDGIYKLINKEVASIVEKNFLYINRESDMGNSGLRKAKKSYRPDHMINVFKIDENSF